MTAEESELRELRDNAMRMLREKNDSRSAELIALANLEQRHARERAAQVKILNKLESEISALISML